MKKALCQVCMTANSQMYWNFLCLCGHLSTLAKLCFYTVCVLVHIHDVHLMFFLNFSFFLFLFFFAPSKRIPAAKQEATEGTVGSPNLVQIL